MIAMTKDQKQLGAIFLALIVAVVLVLGISTCTGGPDAYTDATTWAESNYEKVANNHGYDVEEFGCVKSSDTTARCITTISEQGSYESEEIGVNVTFDDDGEVIWEED